MGEKGGGKEAGVEVGEEDVGVEVARLWPRRSAVELLGRMSSHRASKLQYCQRVGTALVSRPSRSASTFQTPKALLHKSLV